MKSRNSSLAGLRGFAVILVVLMHLNPGSWPENPIEKYVGYGWLGVDLFFVLSGFFIAQLAYKRERNIKGYVFFIVNRFLRVAPVYYISIVFLLSFPFLYLDQIYTHHYLKDNVIYFISFMSNILFYFNSEPYGIGHFWSLAVELHFYVLFGLFLILAPRKIHMSVCVLVLVTSVFLRFVTYDTLSGYSVYRLTFARLDGLILGSLVYIIYSKNIKVNVNIVRCVGVFCLVALIYSIESGMHVHSFFVQVFGYFLFPLLFACMVFIMVRNRTGLLSRIFDNSILEWFGNISYSLYVWHLIVLLVFGFDIKEFVFSFDFGNQFIYNLIYFSTIIILSVFVSFLSYVIIESKFEEIRKNKVSPKLEKYLK